MHSDDDNESSWSSDSDASSSSERSELATTTLLGLPDGLIETSSDVQDTQVSRVGGAASFLPGLMGYPPISATQCPNCSQNMELLVQLYAPLEGTVDDRVVYVWGCARGGCQGERSKGSVRAFTSMRRNDKFATVHERRAAKKAAHEAAKKTAIAATTPMTANVNPFAAPTPGAASNAPFNPFAVPSTTDAAAANPFAASNNPFAPALTAAPSLVEAATPNAQPSNETSVDSAIAGLSIAASVAGSDSAFEGDEELDPAWAKLPAYPAQYLSTQTEYIPRPKRTKAQKAADAAALAVGSPGNEESILARSAAKPADWDEEGYVKGSGIPGADETFERFLHRIQHEPGQVIRYDFGANPLAYSSASKLHKLLFQPVALPLPSTTASIPIAAASGGGKKASSTASAPAAPAPTSTKRAYDASKVPACVRCHGPRVYELQLMPGLLNHLKVADLGADEEAPAPTAVAAANESEETRRRRELERVLGGKGIKADARTGMEWGTIGVWSCEKGCGGEWGEEWVGVEWED